MIGPMGERPDVTDRRMADDDWQRLVSDPATEVATLVVLAGDPKVNPAALVALAADEDRLRRAPAIAGAIYRNPGASMSIANRVVVTCQRLGVVPDEIPEFEELARAIVSDPAALEPAVTDLPFAELLQAAPGAPETDQEAPGPGLALAPAEPKSGRRRSAAIDFTKLKLYEKVRLATLGNANCRQNLLRDPNRMVALAAIRSPQITDGEVAKAAGNRSLSEEVIRYIANRKELVKQYAVKLALVGNSKCPLGIALRLLPSLHAEDIKQLARSKNVPGALSVAARRLAAARGPQ